MDTHKDVITHCPHCNAELKKWRVPENSTWNAEYFLVCFNDQCPYFVKGWKVLAESVHTRASYRFRVDPVTNCTGPLPVWSIDALKDGIIS